MSDGLLLFACYAYPPNSLGYCGPADNAGLLGYLGSGVGDRGLREMARHFEGAYPYLVLIARANGIEDPFDRRVVEAYWVGNALLERVGPGSFFQNLTARFRPRMDARTFEWMTSVLPLGARPHHNFHVFDVYRRAGLMRDDRAVVALDRMDQCRISWGRVVAAEGPELVVERRPLALAGGRIVLGSPAVTRVSRHMSAGGVFDDIAPGDVVSIHWSWACQRLDRAGLGRLMRATERVISHTNLTL